MRAMPSGRLCTALAAALCAAAGPARAQAPAAPGLTLEQALASAAERSGGVRQAREQLAGALGGARAAQGTFDPTLTSFVTSTRDNTLRWNGGGGADAVPASRTLGVQYGVAMERRFRSGLVLSPEIRAQRREFSPDAAGRNNTASALVVVGMPVLRGAGGQLAAPERAAGALADAARADLLHAASVGALDAARAYWAYAAATERVEVQRQAEERSRRLVEQTRVLVAAQERAEADLNPLLAALASRQAARSASEQDLAEARRTLGLAMGVDGDSIALLPPPSTPLPARGGAPLPEAGALVARAVARRMDLAGARQAAGAQRVLADAAQAGTRPRLDLQLSVGYTGAVPGESWAGLVTPFYRDLNSWSASLEVSWQAALRNAAAAGTAEQSRARQRQGEVAAQELEREIRSGVAVAALALRHGEAELERADEAVRLSRTAVENEERKFQLGMSTLFDIIQSEDALTSALLSRIAAQERLAGARARLAFETGALVRDEDGRPVADPSAVAFSPLP